MQNNQSLTFVLVLSLGLHGLIAAAMLYLPEWSAPENQSVPVEIVIKERSRGPSPVLVRPNTQPIKEADPIEALKQKAKLLSDATQRFKEEMMARKIGKNQNQNSQVRRKKQGPPNNKESLKLFKKGQMLQQASDDLRHKKLYFGESSLRQRVPGIKNGGFTALNTDQFIHYTFFARTNEQVLNRWVMNVHNFVDTMKSGRALHTVSHKNHITQVEVLLDEDGNYVDTIVVQSSGYPAIDKTVIKAFKDAAPVKNPPEEMVEADGNIHLRYRFHLVFDPRRLAQGS